MSYEILSTVDSKIRDIANFTFLTLKKLFLEERLDSTTKMRQTSKSVSHKKV